MVYSMSLQNDGDDDGADDNSQRNGQCDAACTALKLASTLKTVNPASRLAHARVSSNAGMSCVAALHMRNNSVKPTLPFIDVAAYLCLCVRVCVHACVHAKRSERKNDPTERNRLIALVYVCVCECVCAMHGRPRAPSGCRGVGWLSGWFGGAHKTN